MNLGEEWEDLLRAVDFLNQVLILFDSVGAPGIIHARKPEPVFS